jgi:hypothetical protein
MITKSEEENIMDAAIGQKISDYLIKPVNPKQVLLSIKKNLDTKRLITKKTTAAYQSEFTQISMNIDQVTTFEQWVDVYKKLVYWDLELHASEGNELKDVLHMQKSEANTAFSKFIEKQYPTWFGQQNSQAPLLSPALVKNKVIPHLEQDYTTVFILIDNLRYDQWCTIQPFVEENFNVIRQELYCSILPTATQYARNAIFSGLMPYEIQQMQPKFWAQDEDELNNKNEAELLEMQLKRFGHSVKTYYDKIITIKNGKKIIDNLNNILNHKLVVLVYNFVDMLSHANTDMAVVRELASDDAAYRSLTLSWFQHSHLNEVMRELRARNVRIVLTTDHGTIRVNNPVKIVGDKKASKNIRYKVGKNLNYNAKDVFEIHQPESVHLPKYNVSSRYIFAAGNNYLVYPKNYNHYVRYYHNTYQHGGVSMEEMLVPVVLLEPK